MADIYYDITSGNDSTGNGAYATPYATIEKVRTVMSSGDTIILKDGTHTISADTYANGLPSCTFRSESNDPSLCIIQGSGTNAYFHTIVQAASTTLNVSGITFRNLNTDSLANFLAGGGFPPGGYVGLFAQTGAGWFTGPLNTSIYVRNCVFDNIKITLDGNNAAIFSVEYGSTSAVIDVRNCVFNEIWNSLGSICYCPAVSAGNTILFHNNVVYMDGFDGIYYMVNAAADVPFYFNNNILVAANGVAQNVFYNSGSYPVEFNNNCLYALSGSWANHPAGTGNITSDPLFVSVATLDFHLRPTSPCIGTGRTL